MDKVRGLGKEMEQLVLQHDPAYEKMQMAIGIVREFIIEHGLIIYGGTAIDFAMRLHGDSIYSEASLLAPDLDFYSPCHAEHAYKLADILYSAGFASARTIVGLYTRVMRVDIIDNHWVADISYVPEEVFKHLPFIVYNGMRIIHPDFQRADMHSALSLPYDFPPIEVIFARWKKDVDRFNKLTKYYPLPHIKSVSGGTTLQIPIIVRKHVLCGFVAYAAIYAHTCAALKKLGDVMPESIPRATFTITDEHIEVGLIPNIVEIIHMDIEKCGEKLSLENKYMREPYVGLLPQRLFGNIQDVPICILSTRDKLVSSNNLRIGASETVIRVTNVHFILKYFLARYFDHTDTSPKNIYIYYYNALMDIISYYESVIARESNIDARNALAMESPLFPTINIYGSENRSLSYLVDKMRIEHDLSGEPLPIIPRNYHPANGAPHPKFNPYDSEIFRESGAIMSKN